jgi:hypothetical protein
VKAVVWHGKEDVRVEDVGDPTLQEPSDAIRELLLLRSRALQPVRDDPRRQKPPSTGEPPPSRKRREPVRRGTGSRLVLELTDGRGADSVIDAVGMEAHGSALDGFLQTTKIQLDRTHAFWECMRSVCRGGTVSLTGVHAGPVHLFPLGGLFDLGVTLRMGQANVHRWVPAIPPLLEDETDPLGIEDFSTHDLPLEAAPHAYKMFQRKEDGCIKVVLHPSASRVLH